MRSNFIETGAASTQASALREAAEAACRAHAAYVAARAACRAAGYRGGRNDYLIARAAYDRAVLEARRAFADLRGWAIARSGFDPLDLVPEPERRERRAALTLATDGHVWCHAIDHEEYYRAAGRGGRPVAILSHTYAPLDEVAEFAAARGLAVEALGLPSWYSPGNTVAVVFTRAAPAERQPSNVIAFPGGGRRA